MEMGKKKESFKNCPKIAGDKYVTGFDNIIKIFAPTGDIKVELVDGSHVYCKGEKEDFRTIDLRVYNPILKTDKAKAVSYYTRFGYEAGCAGYQTKIDTMRAVTINQVKSKSAYSATIEKLLDTFMPASLSAKYGGTGVLASIGNLFISKYKKDALNQPLYMLLSAVDAATNHLAPGDNVKDSEDLCDGVADLVAGLCSGRTGISTPFDQAALAINGADCQAMSKDITK